MSIYQGDTYTFTLTLTRKESTEVVITGVVQSGSTSVYSYYLTSGPALHLGNNITITGMGHSGNNGPFTITDLDFVTDSMGFVTSSTFTVTNSSGTTQTEAGTGIVGTTPNVTTAPVLQVIRLSDMSPMLGSPAAMTALDNTNQLWAYSWSVGSAISGQYVAIVSYASDGNTFTGAPIEKITVGDTRIIGTVALDGTVAKDATVAKDSTVAKSTDIAGVNPDTSATILAIKAKTDNLPVDPTGLTNIATQLSEIDDVHDALLGNQAVDKTQNPAVYTVKRVNNSILAQYQVTDTDTQTAKTRI